MQSPQAACQHQGVPRDGRIQPVHNRVIGHQPLMIIRAGKSSGNMVAQAKHAKDGIEVLVPLSVVASIEVGGVRCQPFEEQWQK